MKIDASAGKPADPSVLVNVPKLVAAYYLLRPDPSDPRQRVVFGTSGHRGSAFDGAFNEWHILAITQAICDYRKLAENRRARSFSEWILMRCPNLPSQVRLKYLRPTTST